jgi:hypothetical protein
MFEEYTAEEFLLDDEEETETGADLEADADEEEETEDEVPAADEEAI